MMWTPILGEQAFEMRTLVILMDGIDEAAALKQNIEEFVLHVLVPLKMRIVVTSRPEARAYAHAFTRPCMSVAHSCCGCDE